MKKNAKFKHIFHFDRVFTKLKIINVNGAGSLRLSRNYHVIDYAPGIVIFYQSDDRNLPMRYITCRRVKNKQQGANIEKKNKKKNKTKKQGWLKVPHLMIYNALNHVIFHDT